MRLTQCATSPSSLLMRRFSQCAVGPSSLLRDEVYLVCSVSFIHPKRRCLRIVQWAAPHPRAPHPWLCTIYDYEVYSVCCGPLIPNWVWKMRFTLCATSPSSLLSVRFSKCVMVPSSLTLLHRWGLPTNPVCSEPLIPNFAWKMRLTQCATSPSSLPMMRFSQCAVGPSSLLRDEVCLVCSGPLNHPKSVYALCSEPLILDSAW